MPYKDPEKQKEANRLAARRRRANKKLQKFQGKTSTVSVSKKKTRTKIRSEALSDEDLNGLDLKALTLGKLAIEKALQGLDNLEPSTLDPIDIKRLGEFGLEMVRAAQDSLEGRKVKEEEDVTWVAKVHEDPEAQEHVHGLLRIVAAAELDKEIPKPEYDTTD